MNEWMNKHIINELIKGTNKQIKDNIEKESLNKCTKHLYYGTNKQANEKKISNRLQNESRKGTNKQIKDKWIWRNHWTNEQNN